MNRVKFRMKGSESTNEYLTNSKENRKDTKVVYEKKRKNESFPSKKVGLQLYSL